MKPSMDAIRPFDDPEAFTRLTYQQQLLDPRWQRKRLEIMQRDTWTCRDCDSRTKQLTVHHCIYLRTCYLWEYADELLMTVCWNCHQTRQRFEESIHASLAKILSQWPQRRLEQGHLWYLEQAQKELGLNESGDAA